MTTETPARPRAALYLRISKLPKGSRSKLRGDDGTSYSVEDQDVRCVELCEKFGYDVVNTFYDDGTSAWRSLKDRAGYGDMKAALAGGEFDVLVFDRQDRLARDESETMRFVADCKDAGIAWHSVREHQIDLSEPFHRLNAIMRGGEAERYSTSISLNQRAGNQRKRDLGLPGAGPRPFGFEDDKITHRKAEANLIREGTKMLLAGSPRYAVMKMFRDSGVKSSNGKDWHSAKVGKVLSRWRNAGWVEFEDQPHKEAVWKPIVSRADLESVRAILSQGRAPGRWKTPQWLCSGIGKCHCGYQLVATRGQNGSAYRCGEILAKAKADLSPGPHITITASILDKAVRDGLLDAYMSRPVSSRVGQEEAAALGKLYQRRDEAKADRARVQAGFMAKILSESEAAREVGKAEATIEAIDDEIIAAAAQSAHTAMLQEVMATLWLDLQAGASPYSKPDADGLRTFNPRQSMLNSLGREGLSPEDAINRGIQTYWAGDDETKAEIRAALAERFDGLALEDRRNLVRSLLSIEVLPGVGAKRMVIEPIDLPAAS